MLIKDKKIRLKTKKDLAGIIKLGEDAKRGNIPLTLAFKRL